MPKIKLIIEYDGTDYVGWQLQPNGISIQQVMEESLERILKEHVRLHSSGRTDAGVHALGMVVCFETERSLPLTAYADGMNCLLPPDIAVLSAEEVPENFDPRRHAKSKHYRYSILCSKRRRPLSRLHAWYLREELDLERMREGAAFFIGEHDFAAFRTSGCAAKTTVRRIDSLQISVDGELIHLDVVGSGFMRNMVRIMVGTLVEIGKGKMQPENICKCLTGICATPGPTAPSQGLCLIDVRY